MGIKPNKMIGEYIDAVKFYLASKYFRHSLLLLLAPLFLLLAPSFLLLASLFMQLAPMFSRGENQQGVLLAFNGNLHVHKWLRAYTRLHVPTPGT